MTNPRHLAAGALLLAAPTWAGGPQLSGTLALRNQGLRQGATDIDRRQVQLRLNARQRLGTDTALELRLANGPPDAPNLSFDELRRFFHVWPVYADRYFVEHTRPGLQLRFGRLPPLGRYSEMIFDADVNVDGLTAAWTTGRWTVNLNATALHEPSSFGDPKPGLGLILERDLGGKARAAVGFHQLGDAASLALARADGQLERFDTNRSLVVPDRDGDGRPEAFAPSRFRILELALRTPLRVLGPSGQATVDLVHNTGAPDRDFGAYLELTTEDALRGWRTTVRWFHLEQDATVGGYHGETLAGTNRTGWHAELRRALRKDLDLRAWFIHAEGIDPVANGLPPPNNNEMRLDLLYRW
jgi:hypothetical protein